MEAGEEVIQEKVHDFVPFLCVDDSMVVSPWMERFRIYFNILTYLFGRFGISTNVRKMVSMAFRPCYIPSIFSESAYMRRLIEVIPLYHERLRQRV